MSSPQYKTIAKSNNFIVLDKFTKHFEVNEAPAVYQTEAALERVHFKTSLRVKKVVPWLRNVC